MVRLSRRGYSWQRELTNERREWKLELFDLLDLCAKSRYLAATTPKTTTLKG